VVAPLAISTETCFQLAGVTPRKLRETLARHPDVPRPRIGKTVIVSAHDFQDLLERLVEVGDPPRPARSRRVGGEVNADRAPPTDGPEPDPTREEILARLGRRPWR
jgi:hypothetical protein